MGLKLQELVKEKKFPQDYPFKVIDVEGYVWQITYRTWDGFVAESRELKTSRVIPQSAVGYRLFDDDFFCGAI